MQSLDQLPLLSKETQSDENVQSTLAQPIEQDIQNAQPAETSSAEPNVDVGRQTNVAPQTDIITDAIHSGDCGRDDDEETGLLLENGKRCPWSVRWRNPELMTRDECLKAHEDFTAVIRECYDVLVCACEVDESLMKKWACNFRVIMVSLHQYCCY